MDNINSPELSPTLRKKFDNEHSGQPRKLMGNIRVEDTHRGFEAMRRMERFFYFIEIGGRSEIEQIKFIIENDPLKY